MLFIMEPLNSILHIPYVFHCGIVSIVFVGAVLLFVFGFKSAEEPSFNKLKTDAKSIAKKKKKKDKLVQKLNGSPSVTDNKNKGNSTPKPKTKTSEEKSKKSNALKDSKRINENPKESNKNNKQKSKGKENIDALADFEVEEGLWEQALSRGKKNRKNQNFAIEVPLKGNDKKSSQGGKGKKNKNDGNEIKNKDTSSKGDRKLKDDDGDWQEAKSSKKRRKVQKED